LFVVCLIHCPVGDIFFCDFTLKVGKHGIIIEFTEPETNTKRSATYLPEVPAHEGTISIQ